MEPNHPVRKMLRAIGGHKRFTWTGLLVTCFCTAALTAVIFFVFSGSLTTALAGVVMGGVLIGPVMYIRVVRENRGDFDPPEKR